MPVTHKKYKRRARKTHRRGRKHTRTIRKKRTKQASRKKKQTRQKRAHRRARGAGPKKRKWNFSNSDDFSVKEMADLLEFEDDIKEYNKTFKHANEDAQRRFLMNRLFKQQRHNDELQRYKDDTANWMVEEPGVMPYDARMMYEPSGEQPKTHIEIKPVKLLDLNSKYPAERLKAQWQRRWLNSVFDINHALRSTQTHKPYVKKMRDKYDAEFREFLNTDPAYLAAYEEQVNQMNIRQAEQKERREMEGEEEKQKQNIARERREKEKEEREKEQKIREKEDGEDGDDFTITWEGVKRRKLDYYEDPENKGKLTATTFELRLNDNRDHPYPAVIVFSSPADVSEAYAKFIDKYPKKYVTRSGEEPSVEKAVARATAFINKAYATKHKLKLFESTSQLGNKYVQMYGKSKWIL